MGGRRIRASGVTTGGGMNGGGTTAGLTTGAASVALPGRGIATTEIASGGGRYRERERERDRNGARDRRDEPKREEKQLTEEDKAQNVVLDEPIDNEEMEGLDSDGEMEDEEAKADRILEERRKAR